ncbi:sigma-70 family RNA polymerase sigma factor [Prescottella agglutinans]|uniref:Sigma-70 family RNA polymerase sigma factor n=1 Tax=Prescottella agglutinans TaxID=1644129 RepID=A0A438BC14_9NOCA|nr:RNA polymerase sigma factor ShbA [Prescottella agglutinans]RVW08529.1 sigma-70 family RNA polymerase sigma factor [Prescottella agglutinans]
MNASSWYAPSPSGTDVDSIAAAASTGHDDALADLMARVRPMVLGFCRSRLRESRCVSAEDVTQEVCVAVVCALPRYEHRGRFTAFVFGIAGHKISDALRAAHRDRSLPVGTLPEIGADTDTPENHAVRSEDLRRIETMLAVLTPRQRRILRLRIIDEMSAAETADALHMTPGAVRVAQHRALNRLRAEFAPT